MGLCLALTAAMWEAPSRKRDAGDFWNVCGQSSCLFGEILCQTQGWEAPVSQQQQGRHCRTMHTHPTPNNPKKSRWAHERGGHQGELCSPPSTEPPTLHNQYAKREKHSSLQRETRPSVASSHVCYNPKLFVLCATLVLIIYSSAQCDGPSAFQAEAFKPFLCWRHTERSKCFPWDLEI